LLHLQWPSGGVTFPLSIGLGAIAPSRARENSTGAWLAPIWDSLLTQTLRDEHRNLIFIAPPRHTLAF
jgi:hypothetical protein